MLRQNIIQVHENQKDEITIAKGEFTGFGNNVQIESVSLTITEAKQVIKAMKEVLSDMEFRNALV